MGFSMEWEQTYKNGEQLSVWPWTKLISLVKRHTDIKNGMRVLELGCGMGVNIPFFVSLGVDYFAVEGSALAVKIINEKYKDANVHVQQGDFTKDLLFDGQFDLIVDRSALTHNSTADIKNAIVLIYDKLKIGGKFIGIDWHSDKQSEYENGKFEFVDKNTKIFSKGYYAGLGKVHFSNREHIEELFSSFLMEEIEECVTNIYLPRPGIEAGLNFVVKK